LAKTCWPSNARETAKDSICWWNSFAEIIDHLQTHTQHKHNTHKNHHATRIRKSNVFFFFLWFIFCFFELWTTFWRNNFGLVFACRADTILDCDGSSAPKWIRYRLRQTFDSSSRNRFLPLKKKKRENKK
jgi:hypothetical protein